MRGLGLVAAACAVAIACGSKSSSKANPDEPIGGDDGTGHGLPDARPPDQINDGGSFNVGNRGNDGGHVHDGGRDPGDATFPDTGGGIDATSDDASMQDADDGGIGPGDDSGSNDSGGDSGTVGPPNACPGSLGAGDLAVVELVIASQSGSGDRGEWVEVQSTRQCSLDLRGLHAASGAYSLDVTTDTWLAPNGIIVIADTADSTANHSLPSPLLVWDGSPADVLPDTGGEIVLSVGGTKVDDLPYPAFVLYACRSISFPADCAWSDRSSWARWSYSFNTWTGGCQGTPDADNTDVACY